jgi:hypothetical protein
MLHGIDCNEPEKSTPADISSKCGNAFGHSSSVTAACTVCGSAMQPNRFHITKENIVHLSWILVVISFVKGQEARVYSISFSLSCTMMFARISTVSCRTLQLHIGHERISKKEGSPAIPK